MKNAAILGPIVLIGHVLIGRVDAQDKAKVFTSLAELKASYTTQLLDLDRRQIADMTALAATQEGDVAEPTYRELFGLAVARDLYKEAEPAARKYLEVGSKDPQERALAGLVSVIALADRGAHDESLAELGDLFRGERPANAPARAVDTSTAIAVGEAYLERLLRGGRYDIAKKACEMAIQRRPEPEIRDHFRARLLRLNMLGKQAPEIAGRDLEGDEIKLSDYRGKVVLVDFWATWCPPCLAAVPQLQALQAKYPDDEFVILGVNLDAHRHDVEGIASAAPVVKQFLLNARVSWPSILMGEPQEGDPADLYGVEEIPASFLVDRSGKIVHLDLIGPSLDKAVSETLKP